MCDGCVLVLVIAQPLQAASRTCHSDRLAPHNGAYQTNKLSPPPPSPPLFTPFLTPLSLSSPALSFPQPSSGRLNSSAVSRRLHYHSCPGIRFCLLRFVDWFPVASVRSPASSFPLCVFVTSAIWCLPLHTRYLSCPYRTVPCRTCPSDSPFPAVFLAYVSLLPSLRCDFVL